MRRHSTYNYAFNNSIFFIDPDGMVPTTPPENHTYANGDFWKDNDGIWQWDSENQAWNGIGKTDSSMAGSDNYELEKGDSDDGSGNREGEVFNTVGDLVHDIAEDQIGKTDWDKANAKGPSPKNTDKCNLFCADMYKEAGVTNLFFESGNPMDTTTLSNGNPEGFEVVGRLSYDVEGNVVGDISNARAGDVIVGVRNPNRDGARQSGHAGIVSSLSPTGVNLIDVQGSNGVGANHWRNISSNSIPRNFKSITIRRYAE